MTRAFLIRTSPDPAGWGQEGLQCWPFTDFCLTFRWLFSHYNLIVILKSLPKTGPICHFLYVQHMLWHDSSYSGAKKTPPKHAYMSLLFPTSTSLKEQALSPPVGSWHQNSPCTLFLCVAWTTDLYLAFLFTLGSISVTQEPSEVKGGVTIYHKLPIIVYYLNVYNFPHSWEIEAATVFQGVWVDCWEACILFISFLSLCSSFEWVSEEALWNVVLFFMFQFSILQFSTVEYKMLLVHSLFRLKTSLFIIRLHTYQSLLRNF